MRLTEIPSMQAYEFYGIESKIAVNIVQDVFYAVDNYQWSYPLLRPCDLCELTLYYFVLKVRSHD